MKWRLFGALYAAVFLMGLFDASAADPDINQVALAKRLVIPRIEMLDAWPSEALDFIRQKSQELDPNKKGVKLIAFQLPATAIGAPKREGERFLVADLITYSLTNVSVFDAILHTAKLSNLEVTARTDGIFVHPKGKKP